MEAWVAGCMRGSAMPAPGKSALPVGEGPDTAEPDADGVEEILDEAVDEGLAKPHAATVLPVVSATSTTALTRRRRRPTPRRSIGCSYVKPPAAGGPRRWWWVR